MNEQDEILAGLEPLFKEAEEKGLWFFCSYQSLLFSPKELREQHKRGSFIWGAANWQLRDPNERLQELWNISNIAKKEAELFYIRMKENRGIDE